MKKLVNENITNDTDTINYRWGNYQKDLTLEEIEAYCKQTISTSDPQLDSAVIHVCEDIINIIKKQQ